MTVISKHHQALENAPEGWIVSARDSQGLVEAIEDPREEFMLGVQWHPELSGPEGPNGQILRAFVDAATQYASTHSATTNIQV
jgi:putative glutamine amidotransferase